MHRVDAERTAGILEATAHNHVDDYASGPCAENKRIQKTERLNTPIIKMKTIREENSEETRKKKAVHCIRPGIRVVFCELKIAEMRIYIYHNLIILRCYAACLYIKFYSYLSMISII